MTQIKIVWIALFQIIDFTSKLRIINTTNIFSILANFVLIVLITCNKDKYVYLLTGLKLLLSIILDTFLISSLNLSLNLGVNGIAISNIIINFIIFNVNNIHIFTSFHVLGEGAV